MPKFLVQGGQTLKGTVNVSGSKNASLPVLAATLLADSPSVLHNVPDISDVHAFLKILSGLGAEVSFESGTVRVNPTKVACGHSAQPSLEKRLVQHMRASILLLGPLLARCGEARFPYPGGCVLGKRSVHAHLHALSALGGELVESNDEIHMRTTGLKPAKIIMSEASVTATENALMAAVLIKGTTEIRWAAMEPHVQDLCKFLVAMGAEIEGIGSHTLIVHGGAKLHGAEHSVTPDYLEAGTLTLAAVLCNGEVTIKNCPVEQLDSFWQKLEEVGAHFELGKNEVTVHPHNGLYAVEKLQTAVYPGFPTDLQAPFAVLLTQCDGETRIYETLFEGRLNYLTELQRMGAHTEIQNEHEAIVRGPTPLKAVPIVSCDIRAGAAMVLAALIANGGTKTEISEINYIDRGYEGLDEKLRSLGAKIERSQ